MTDHGAKKMNKTHGDVPSGMYVTYRQLVLAMGGTVAAVVGAIFGGWQIHVSQPHHGAVEQHEIDRLNRVYDGRLDSLQTRVDYLGNKVDQLMLRKLGEK